jgi:hypothetical protein
MRRVSALVAIAVLWTVLGLVSGPAGAAAGAHSIDATDWVQRYDPAGLLDRAWGVAVSPDGTRLFVTGQSTSRLGNRDYATIAYDAVTGDQLWVARYNGPGVDSYDAAWAVGVAPDGSRVYVTGGSGTTFTTVAYDAATGAQQWVARYYGGTALRLVVSPDGTKVFVGGGDGWRWHTIAYDTLTGGQVWNVQFVESYPVSLQGLAVSADGSRLFATGSYYSYFGSSTEAVTVAYDTEDGQPLWTATYDDPNHESDIAHAVAVSPDGSRVFVTGTSFPEGNSVYLTIAYDAATGDQSWVSTYDNQGKGGHVANAVGVSVDGSLVFVTGVSWGTNSNDYATVAYDTGSGAQVWVSRYNGPVNGGDTANALAVDPTEGLVYVTGRSTGHGTSYDYATVAYDVLTGDQVWEDRYDNIGHGEDQAQAVAAGASGAVYVTGGSLGAGGRSDYATVGRIP